MPATRTNRKNNPLRLLRLILGEGKTPMHQEEFANRTGISVATLRSIEAGRRPLGNENVLDQIAIIWKAQWHPAVKRWFVINSTIPYEKKYAAAKAFDPEDPYLDDYTLHRLTERMLDIFSAATREQRQALLVHLNKHLKVIAKSFGIKANLQRTEPEWIEQRNGEYWGKPLKPLVILPVYEDNTPDRMISPHDDAGGVLDFRSRRTFNPAEYPARTSEEALAMQQARQAERKSIPH